MTVYKSVKSREMVMGKLTYGCDLLEELTNVCKKQNVKLGRIEAIGAVQKSCVGFYSQVTRTYQFLNLEQPMEILTFMGNISMKDGEPFVHAHITMADEEGKAYGGHLAPGTVVFACEFILEAFDGPEYIRMPDQETGLPLWSMEK